MGKLPEKSIDQTHSRLNRIHELLDSGTMRQTARMINGLLPVQVARLLESSPPASRGIIWELVDSDIAGEVLEELAEEVRDEFIRDLDSDAVIELTDGLETDDIVDILQQLPEQVTQDVLAAMSEQDRLRIEAVIDYDEDSAGGLTNPDTITVRPRFTLDVVLRYLRRHPELPPSTDSLIVVNRKDDYLGLLPLSKLLTSDTNLTVRDVMVTDTNAIKADMSDHDVAKLFEQHDWVSAPVVNEQGKLIGRITIDDVVDVIREESDHALMGMAGLDQEDDTFASVRKAMPRRAIWLGINLLTAVLASSVINIFQDTIDKVVALAVLMPIVASMGGVAGSQTLTVVIRGMAVGHIGPNNLRWLLNRELQIGILNGMLWALAMGGLVALWFSDWTMAAILGGAMIANLVTAAIAGALLPNLLKKMHIDPALAGGVTLTTVTDVVGFFCFLGLATIFYA